MAMYDIIRHRVNPGQDGYMYLRKSKKPNGRTYLTIVQGYRDAGGIMSAELAGLTPIIGA